MCVYIFYVVYFILRCKWPFGPFAFNKIDRLIDTQATGDLSAIAERLEVLVKYRNCYHAVLHSPSYSVLLQTSVVLDNPKCFTRQLYLGMWSRSRDEPTSRLGL